MRPDKVSGKTQIPEAEGRPGKSLSMRIPPRADGISESKTSAVLPKEPKPCSSGTGRLFCKTMKPLPIRPGTKQK